MARRAVGVAMDHARIAELPKRLDDRIAIHVHDLRRLLLHLPLTLFTHLLDDRFPHRQRLRQEIPLPRRIADLGAERLVLQVVGAQCVAVHEQRRGAVQVYHGGVLVQRCAGEAGELVANQKIPIAVHEIERHA